MRPKDTTDLACGEHRLLVEWHDCSWQPAIQQPEAAIQQPEAVQQRPAGLSAGFIKPLPMPVLLPHPARRKSLFKLMKKNPSGPRRFEVGFTLVELLTVIAIIAILAAMLLPVLSRVKLSAYKTQAKIQVNEIATDIQAYDSAYGRFPVSSNAQFLATSFTTGGSDITYGGYYTNASGLTWPNTTTPTASAYDPSNSEVIAILMDYTNFPNPNYGSSTVNMNYQLNPQKTQFLNAKLSGWDPSQPGLPLPGVGNDLVYRDPWGNPYLISMDLNYDGQCQDAFYGYQAVSQTAPNSQTGYNGLINPTGNPNSNNFRFHGTVMVWSMGPYGPGTPSASSFAPTLPSTSGVNKNHILSWQ
jgi:prepilin-type N-terminal cleavage/methylation domain-containing protein